MVKFLNIKKSKDLCCFVRLHLVKMMYERLISLPFDRDVKTGETVVEVHISETVQLASCSLYIPDIRRHESGQIINRRLITI